jgi:hypothetical protein
MARRDSFDRTLDAMTELVRRTGDYDELVALMLRLDEWKEVVDRNLEMASVLKDNERLRDELDLRRAIEELNDWDGTLPDG